MKDDLLQLRGADQLLGRVADALQAMEMPGEGFITSRLGEYTRFAGDRIHQPQAIEECQLMVRAAGAHGGARAGTTRLESAAAAGREASRLARGLTVLGGGRQALARPGQRVDTSSLWHQGTLDFTAPARAALAARAIHDAGGVRATACGMFSRVVIELAVGNSEGVALYTRATEASFSVLVRRDEGSGYRGDLVRDVGTVEPERFIEGAVADAVLSGHPEPLAPGSYDVVLGPLAVGDMIGFFGSLGFTGDALAAGHGPVAQRRGVRVADDMITVRDDASRPTGLPIPFDLEGVAKQNVTMLDQGRIGDAVLDLGTATTLGRESTGHAHIGREEAPAPTPANLMLEPGDASVAELVAGVDRGVYLSRFWYTRLVDGEQSSITGVSRDAAFRIRDGALGPPVANGRFTEQVFGALSRADGVGKDLVSQPIPNVWNGCVTAPALRVRGFHLGFR